VADLLGRTPAAVSRSFGNLWAAQTGGKLGLKHCSHIAEEVVREYEHDLRRLHSEAQRLRALRIPASLTPRLELHSETDQTPLPEEVVRNSAQAAGLAPDLYFVSTRPGTVAVDVGILLDGLVIGTTAWLAITNTIQLIRDYLRHRDATGPVTTVVATSRTWTEIAEGRTQRVEERVVKFHLPGFPTDVLPTESRARLAGFLSFIRGVRQRPALPAPLSAVGPQQSGSRGRPFTRHGLERMLAIDLSGVPDASVKRLSDLVKAARRRGFDAALRSTRRTARPRRQRRSS
jgi:hypothetical protein